MVVHNRPEISHNSSLNANKSEDNSSGDCSSTFSVPAGQITPILTIEPELNTTNLPPKSVIKVRAAIHDEDPSSSKNSNLSTKHNTFDTEPNLPTPNHHVTKSTSTDTPLSLGTPVSATDVAAALLGASTSSLSASSFRSVNRPRRFGGIIDEDDLSTPYNHYRCLSPNDGRHSLGSDQRLAGGRLLKRQFSLDRGDDQTSASRDGSADVYVKPTPRLSKQNSAGAAHDLERIEEIPKGMSPSTYYQHHRHRSDLTPPFQSSMSVSVDSLSLQ